jgi:competence protein ComEC
VAAVTSRLELHLLNVGQGEAILIDLPDGSFMLLDGGPKADAAGILDAVEARVKAKRRFRLAGISQWDADHIRGIPAILARCKPEEFRYPGIDLQLFEEIARREADEDLSSLTSDVRAAIEALPPVAQQTFIACNALDDLGGVEAYVLSPSPHIAGEIRHDLARSGAAGQSVLKKFRNRTSVAIWLRFAGRTLFLAGEAEEDQYRVMEDYFLRKHGALVAHRKAHAADWIKLSHHGADKNNPDELFKFFAGSSFVGAASAGGGYDHPHPAALKRLHFDHGGSAMCTGLGKGCHRILTGKKKLDPTRPDLWALALKDRKNPDRDCYGTITVTVASDGTCSTRAEAVQKSCPYGGPVNGKRAW